MSKRIQGIVIGALVTALLFGGVVAASHATENIEVIYRNIRLIVDGNEFIPKDINGNIVEPFIHQGTTYLPIRAVSQALGKEVVWDGETSTVFVGDSFFDNVVIPTQGVIYNADDWAWNQVSTSSAVNISENNVLSLSKLSDGTEVCWYIIDDIRSCAYRKHGGEWIRFVTEDSGYLDGYGAEPYSNLFGHSGFYIKAPRGAAYYAYDYYYFDTDGKLQFLFGGTYLDTPVDFNNDSNNDLLYFYHAGRIARYYYKVGEDILMFDIIEALSARFANWENIEIDPLSLHNDTIQLSYWRGDNQHNAQISFTADTIIVQI